MIPKEKAKELVYKYSHLVTSWDCYWDTEISIENRIPQMKECALIVVDEIINMCKLYHNHNVVIDTKIYTELAIDYWQEVEQEIENF